MHSLFDIIPFGVSRLCDNNESNVFFVRCCHGDALFLLEEVMNKEWSEYFKFICSIYSGEIAELMKNTKYETEAEKTACYYENAALVALRHFNRLKRETDKH